MALLEVEGLTFQYPKSEYQALSNVCFQVESGKIVLLMGESGSGKTTLLRLLKKEIAPFGTLTGKIRLSCGSTGFVFQNPENSIVTDRVISELAFGLENLGKSRDEISLKTAEMLAYFNFEDMIDKNVAELSGGTKQLLALAGVLIMRPQLILLDEPVSQLDPAAAELFINMLLKINRELGTTVIISSHSPGELMCFADSVLMLEQGKLLFREEPRKAAHWMKESGHPMLRAMPASVRLFEQNPLSVREARQYAPTLRETPLKQDELSEACIVCKGVVFAYGKRERDILNALSYRAERGKINAVIGSNGCGKTTFLKILASIYRPYGGKVSVRGKTALMPQTVRGLFHGETVSQLIGEETAAMMEISHLMNRHPFDISGGEAQRLALAMVLETGADILLLDEPAKGMDARFKHDFSALLKRLCRQGKTIVLVSHDIDFVGAAADRVSFLSDGRMVASMPRRQFFSSVDSFTTEVRRITSSVLQWAVSEEDIV